MPCDRPHRRKPASAGTAVPDALAQLSDRGLAEALAEGIFVGHPDMPEFVFEADEVGAILAYLKSIQER
jgi:hypothetical protein